MTFIQKISALVGFEKRVAIRDIQLREVANMIEYSTEAIVARGTDGRITSWNKGAEMLFGYTREESIGKLANEHGFVKLTEEDMLEAERKIDEHGFWNTERRYYHKDGSSFFGIATGNNVRNDKGEITSFLFIIRDISERKAYEDQLRQLNEELEEKVMERTEEIVKKEKLFRALIENNNDMIALMDNSFRTVYRSPSAERITGWSNADLQELASPVELAHPDDLEKIGLTFKEIMAQPGKQVNLSYRGRHKKGHYIWIEGTIVNSLADKDIEAIVFNFREVTERIEAEKALSRMNEELEERVRQRTEQLKGANEEMESFIYSVTHDLRSPLRSIIGFSSILEDTHIDKTDPEAMRMVGVIKKNVIKMGDLIDNLLEFSRLGQLEMPKGMADMGRLVNELVLEYGQQPTARTIVWDIHSLPVVSGNINALRQVWVNLISNAIKYSGKEEKQYITIGSFCQEDTIVFFVKDNGVGFDEQYRDKLFKVFQRLHHASEFEGIGVGLAIVSKVISKHGGRCWAKSEPGKGATFCFSLPHTDKLLSLHP